VLGPFGRPFRRGRLPGEPVGLLAQRVRLGAGTLDLLFGHGDPPPLNLRLLLAARLLGGFEALRLLLRPSLFPRDLPGIGNGRARHGEHLLLAARRSRPMVFLFGLLLGLLRLVARLRRGAMAGDVHHGRGGDLQPGQHLEAGRIEIAIQPAAGDLLGGGGAEGDGLEIGRDALD